MRLAYEVELPDAGVEGALLDELDAVVLDAQLAGVGVHRAPLQDADLALLQHFIKKHSNFEISC